MTYILIELLVIYSNTRNHFNWEQMIVMLNRIIRVKYQDLKQFVC